MINVTNLNKNFGAFSAVKNLSFSVKGGEVLGFLGPNGAGKSTTMKMLTGFLSPSSGTAEIGGFDIESQAQKAKSLLGYLPESGSLYPEMTVSEFLYFIAKIRGLKKQRMLDSMNRVVELCHLEKVLDQPIETLSKGYRRRVGLAQATIHDPTYLILDEPTDGLDPNQKHEVRNLVKTLSDQKSIILSTHILEEVEAMCTRIIIINEGEMIRDDTPDKLKQLHPDYGGISLQLSNLNNPEIIQKQINSIPQIGKIIQEDTNRWKLLPKNNEDIQAMIWELAREKKWKISHLTPLATPLDEVFRKLTKLSKQTT